MNHPGPEKWAPYLYGESRPEVRQEMKAHLESCPECRIQVEEMQISRDRLDAWKLARLRNPDSAASKVRWAVAAVLLVLCGFVFGQANRGPRDMVSLEKRVESRVRGELATELRALVQAQVSQASAVLAEGLRHESARLLAAGMNNLENQRAQDHRAWQAALRGLEAQRLNDLATLKKELDTLAFNTDAGLRHTAAGLIELANHTASPPVSSEEKRATQ